MHSEFQDTKVKLHRARIHSTLSSSQLPIFVMELNTIGCFLAAGILFLLILINNKRRENLPPGPPGWPIIGNLHQLGDKPHQSLFHFGKKHGPLMTLRLGTTTTVVVSSPSIAKEVMKDNDQTFSSRPLTIATELFGYQGSSLVWSPYGPHWRFLRKIANSEIFSAKKLDALEHLRRDEVFKTIDSIFKDSRDGKTVNIGAGAFMISLGLVGKMVCGKDVFYPGSKQAVELKDMVWEVLKLSGAPNVSDFFPFLARFDLQGLNRKIGSIAKRFDSMFDRLIEERLRQREENDEKDFLQVLLDVRKDSMEFTLEHIKGILMDMFIAGTETTSSTIEWAMTELLRNPLLMKKAHEELDEVVGVERRMEESDIPNLPYLAAIVKEVLRVHPVVPLIIRRADKACEVGGYIIPENTRVFVNVWGIGRDPNVWKDPLNFNPERFLKCDIDYRGQEFELLPFGAGRRICIGLPLAHRMVHLVVGSLLQAFNWSIRDGSGIDMSEVFGLTLQKAEPLIAIPTSRLPNKFYS